MKILIAVFLFVGFISCTVEPESLQYGEDACYTCKMTLMDKKFGAELVTKKGRVYKFDDINCMLDFYNSGSVAEEEFSYRLVVDFAQPGTLIEAGDAFYLKSPELKTPMASQIAAFEKKENMDELKKQWNGIYLVWGELVTQFK
jgi:copper chaperone NosL